MVRNEVNGDFIPAGSKPANTLSAAMLIDQHVFVKPELQTALQVTIRRTKGLSRGLANSSAEYTTSMLRFWNFTASQPAATATSMSRFAISISPLWLIPISATM